MQLGCIFDCSVEKSVQILMNAVKRMMDVMTTHRSVLTPLDHIIVSANRVTINLIGVCATVGQL